MTADGRREKRVRTYSLLYAVIRPMLVLSLIQILIFAVLMIMNGGFSSLAQYSFNLLAEKTENRKSYMENTLNQKTATVYQMALSVNERMETLLNETGLTAAEALSDKDIMRGLLSDSAPDLISLIRIDAVNDAFIVLNTGSTYDDGARAFRPGLYFRDSDVDENSLSDNKDIYMEMGSSETAKSHGMTLDFEWALNLDVTDRASGRYDFFFVPVENYTHYSKTPLYSLGYWSGLSTISRTQQGAIRYSLPLATANGEVYGVIGVGLLPKTLEQAIPSADFMKDSTCYVLAADFGSSGSYIPVIHRGSAYSRLVGDADRLRPSGRADKYGLYDFTRDGGPDALGSIQSMNLYGSTSPYRDHSWALISVAEKSAILASYSRLVEIFLISAAVTLLISAFTAMIVSRRLSAPVSDVIDSMDESRANHTKLQFTPSGIAEIDRLAASVVDLQADLTEYASRVSRIITLSGGKIGVFSVDCAACVVFVGESLASVLGLGESFKGDKTVSLSEFRSYIRTVDRQEVLLSLPIFRNTGGASAATEVRELEAAGPDGPRWFRFSLARDRNSVLGLVQDITESTEKLLEANIALKVACAAAEQASRTKTDFLSRMSHDIRTPMNAIIGMTAIAQNHLDDRVRLADCFNKISASSRYLLSLINEVLDMSRIEAGKFVLTEERVDLLELVDSLEQMLKPTVKERGHTMEFEVSELAHTAVISDRLRLQQVLMNILGNAVKYTPNGGLIRMKLSEKPNGQKKTGCFEFVIEDNGRGISPEFLEKLFKPFERETGTPAEKEQGSGLGMAITWNIVHMMNGDIQVKSEVGQGTTFTVTLFLTLDETTSPYEEMHGLRVLVMGRERAVPLLRSVKAEPEHAGDITDVLTALSGSPFSAVILDDEDNAVNMEAARRLSELPSRPVVLCATNTSGVSADDPNVDAWLPEPPDISVLAMALRSFLGRRQIDDLEALRNHDFSGRHILLAEDNELNLEIALEILGMMNLAVDSAENGRVAVEKFSASPEGFYDLVFMDIQMPLMNGLEAARAIRALPRPDAAVTPIIAMTANAFAEDVRSAQNAGMNGHIAKPLDLDKLRETLVKWLGEKQS